MVPIHDYEKSLNIATMEWEVDPEVGRFSPKRDVTVGFMNSRGKNLELLVGFRLDKSRVYE